MTNPEELPSTFHQCLFRRRPILMSQLDRVFMIARYDGKSEGKSIDNLEVPFGRSG